MAQSLSIPIRIQTAAWDEWTDRDEQPSAVVGRAFIVVPALVTRVTADVCQEQLPCVGRWRAVDGEQWRRFELPAAGIEADDGPVEEVIRLRLSGPALQSVQLRVQLVSQLPRLPRRVRMDEATDVAESDLDLGSTESTSWWRDAAAAAEALIDHHIDFVNELFDQPWNDEATWEGNAGGLAFRSASRVIQHWKSSGLQNEPRLSLIVRLARELPAVLTATCTRPRQVLSRVRQMQPVGRVQEVDGTCLRWLARQPGASVAEKAGFKQRVLGVVRFEDADTPENRVVRDFLVRGIQACGRYVREHRHARTHQRIVQVAAFRVLLERLLAGPSVAMVRCLAGIPQPNYVLQHDPRYSQVWRVYVLLVRQQMLEDNVWRWRHRLWAEHCQLALLAALEHLTLPTRPARWDVLLRCEQDAGCFLDARTMPGPVTFRRHDERSRIEFVPSEQLHLHPLVPQRLTALSPDCVMVRRTVHGDVAGLLGIWTTFYSGRNGFEAAAETLLKTLESACGSTAGSLPLRAILLRPRHPAEIRESQVLQWVGEKDVRMILGPVPLQSVVHELADHVQWGLSLA